MKQLSKWDGVELSSDGIRTITSRLAFAEPDPKLGFEFICNLVTTNLITEQSDQAAERIITEEDEAIEDVVFKRDIYEDFWYLLLEDFGNQDVSYRLKNYRINISILEKPIKVFTNEKSGFHNFSNMWVELRDNEKPDSINSYSIVCQSSTQKIVIDYLRKYSSGEHTYIEFNDYCVFKRDFLENREPQNNELKVLNSIKDDSYRISFYGGLEVRNGVYIKDHLPLLIIPKEYVHQKYRLFINESELELESKLLNIFEIDLNNAGIDFTKKNGEVSIKVVKEDIVIDTKQINYQDFPATEYLHNSLENDLLAYDIELGQKNEMNFLNIIPKTIKSEELKDGYISGGYIKVTSEYRIPKSKFEKETINTNWNFINFIGNKEGSKKRIITTTNNFGGNRFKFINNLENLNKLFTSENLIPVFNTNIGDDLNRFINSEIPFSDSKAVWIIYEINGRKKIKQIDSALPTPYEAQTSKASLNQDSFNKITKRNLDWRQLIINTDKDLKKNNDSNADNELWKKYVKFAESIKL